MSIFRALWRLLSGLAAVVRTLAILVFALVFVVSLVVIFRGTPAVQVEDNVALVVAPSGVIVEYDDSDPRQQLMDELMGEPRAVMPIGDMLDAIDAAAEDARIGLLFLKLDEGFSAGQAQLDELGHSIQRFRDSGRPVFAWAPWLGQSQYFLAAHADKIFIDPMGAVFLSGFEVDQLYFAEALESLGVDVHVFRAGEYKSAVEPFVRSDMSDDARSNAQRWLSSLWGHWTGRVGELRAMPAADLQSYADDLVSRLRATGGDLAQVAVESSLVGAALPLSAVRTEAAAIVGRDPDHGSFRQIWQGEYLRALDQRRVPEKTPAVPMSTPKDSQARYLALVHVQGAIVDGEGAPGQAGGTLIRGLIEDATRDENVAGLLLRVDSPGGSVSASEEIRRAVQEFQATGRPVVASMGSVAASGGYWVSMDADAIVAAPSTITGSIGVFGLVPTAEEGFGKLGIRADGTGTTVWAGAMNPARPLSEPAREALDLVVQHDYRLFLQAVADGRDMALNAVESVASGQVWTGIQAQEFGLVDSLGDFATAAERLAELAEVPADTPLELFAPMPDFRTFLLQRLLSQVSATMATGYADGVGAMGGLDIWRAPTAVLAAPLLQGARRYAEPVLGLLSTPNRRGTVAHCLCDLRHGGTP